jgi:hypothetical protein
MIRAASWFFVLLLGTTLGVLTLAVGMADAWQF